MQLVSNLSLKSGAIILTWDYLAMHWSVAPTLVGVAAGGQVYAYTLNGVTRYRLVPTTTYNSTQDAFYSTYNAGVLSGFIVARG